ncbi:MAG TPA: DUF924 family protein [Sandaracinaceae bacterium LLY-WYZ-13_1]|nr:DUF924 family protein [Sandaracinaceae bacterium LLY-WYZ-13_1]
MDFWFGEAPEDESRPSGKEMWFGRSARVDRTIEKRFGRLVDDARAGKLDAWAETPRGRLALILLLDQFGRNIHRETPEAYVGDERALSLCFDGLDEGMDRTLRVPERCFFYMPAMHAEDTDAQLASVEVFQELVEEVTGTEHEELARDFLKHAERHRDIVERFERFPHRNSILGRTSSPDESAFLQQEGEL